MKVLIVDDMDERHKMISLHLESFIPKDLFIDHAYVPGTAIVLLRKAQYDFVFLDHDMGHDLNGADIACCMYRDSFWVPPFVFIHTSNSDGGQRISEILGRLNISSLRTDLTISDIWFAIKNKIMGFF